MRVISWLIQPHNLIFGSVMTYVTVCTEMYPDKLKPRSLLEIYGRSAFWFLTLLTYSDDEVRRFERFAWGAITTGWLWNLFYLQIERRHLPHWLTLLAIYAVMLLVTVCIYVNPQNKDSPPPKGALFRGVLWFWYVPKWLYTGESKKAFQYREAVWALLITGWLITLVLELSERYNWHSAILPIVLEVVMARTTWLVGSNPLWYPEGNKGSKILRNQSILWFRTLPRWYMQGELRIIAGSYTLRIWVLLLIGWGYGLATDTERQLESFGQLLFFQY